MRALRVLGIAENGGHLVCVEVDRAEGVTDTFELPLDDRLRAAVHGDLGRLGQLEIEMEPQLRPREIQSRIRAGATVEQVAAAAACTPERIERYAYPVLMERATIADRAQRTRPLQGAAIGSISAAHADRTLAEIVSATLADRGQQQPQWDAFRDERGWTVTATWRAGRSENRAEWAYHTGPDGGSVTPRDEAASDLVEPAIKPLRTIGERRETATPRSDAVADHRRGAESVTDDRSVGRHPSEASFRPKPADSAHRASSALPVSSARSTEPRNPTALARSAVESRPGTFDDAGGGDAVHDETAYGTPARDDAMRGDAVRTGTDDVPRASSPADAASTDGQEARPSARAAKRGHRPPMPSWEDVLLGTRASGR